MRSLRSRMLCARYARECSLARFVGNQILTLAMFVGNQIFSLAMFVGNQGFSLFLLFSLLSGWAGAPSGLFVGCWRGGGPLPRSRPVRLWARAGGPPPLLYYIIKFAFALATLANARWVLVGCQESAPTIHIGPMLAVRALQAQGQRGGGRAVRERGAPPWACFSATGCTQKSWGSALPWCAVAPYARAYTCAQGRCRAPGRKCTPKPFVSTPAHCV